MSGLVNESIDPIVADSGVDVFASTIIGLFSDKEIMDNSGLLSDKDIIDMFGLL